MATLPKMTRWEFSVHLMRRAPENSEEYWAFHRAAHHYELASLEKNQTWLAQKSRMKAVRAYKKGLKLKESRNDANATTGA